MSIGALQQGRELGAAEVCWVERWRQDGESWLGLTSAAPTTPKDEQTGLAWAGNGKDKCK